MTIFNFRYQHPVGQGFFHTGSLNDTNGAPGLTYVYDCGAMESFADARRRRIKRHIAFTKRSKGTDRLDLLFLSHVHADHVNGLPDLLDAGTGLKADTIVLPLVNVRERLMAFARSAAVDRASVANSFYRDFIVDPAAALARFGPRRIIFVRSSGPDGGAPGSDGRPIGEPSGPEIDGESLFDRRAGWKLVGRGTVGPIDQSLTTGGGNAAAFVIEDSIAIARMASAGAAVAATAGHWLLAPYVDPGVVAGRSTFLNELAHRCSVPRRHLDVWLHDMNNVRDLVINGLDKLVGAYAMVAGNLNTTSLCLYSGPGRDTAPFPRRLSGRFGCIATRAADRVAWLATGDAALKQKRRRDAFFWHYGQLLDQVSTLTLPHHGSDHNFHPDLLTRIRPRSCVASAELYSNWNHPGPAAVQAVCSLPAMLHVVTSERPSRGWECAQLG